MAGDLCEFVISRRAAEWQKGSRDSVAALTQNCKIGERPIGASR